MNIALLNHGSLKFKIQFFFIKKNLFCNPVLGVAFAVCLENKQAREREGVTATYDEEEGTFTRFGSFRVGTITERLQNPQEFKESVQKNEVDWVTDFSD